MSQQLAYAASSELAARVANESVYPLEALPSAPGFDCIVGRSPALLQALRALQQVAPTAATVLIAGESGTGKECAARAIHRHSPRSARPLVSVNCAALPANLIESELFGHERGAFTGATGRREGRFATADGGTIFLDEVGELPLELQPKLLRVLQEGEFEPVGSSRTRRVDVRVVAATNRDLRAEVRAGRFREDLYYRLDVFPVRLPPLRERGGDVALLAQAFLDQTAQRLGYPPLALTRESIRRLEAHAWPGNVRELQNVVERAVIRGQGGQPDFVAALPLAEAASSAVEADRRAPRRVLSAREIEEIERANMLLALETAGGRISGPGGAAQLLGLNPSTLASRLKALGIDRRQSAADSGAASAGERPIGEARYA
jgi:transcriptional regulator with GAF, ATPase, and Fis domain